MDRQELLRRVGSVQQLACIRPMTYTEGRCAGLRAYEVKNGPLEYKVLADKCLDVGELSYRGINFSFLSKPGLQGRNHYDTRGQEALRSIMGGLFFTAGLENICAPCTVDGTDYPMHGRIRTTPAEHLRGDGVWEAGNYVLRTSGEMREGELFGENLVLRRSIETVYGFKTVAIIDEIEDKLREDADIKPTHREVSPDGSWSLLDYGNIVVHVFMPETREYYRLEALWNDAPTIDLAMEAGLENLEYSERIAKLLGRKPA